MVEPEQPRRRFAPPAGRRRGPLRGERGGPDGALDRGAALRGPRLREFRPRGACISHAFAGVGTRLALDHKTISRTEGHSEQHRLETHGNIQRRVDADQLALTRTPRACAEAPQRFLALSTTPAHQGRLKERLTPPLPLHGLGESQGRRSPPQALVRQFAQALFGRTTHRYGCVTQPRSHGDVDRGGPQTPVWLGVAGEDLRAVDAQGRVAEYPGHDDLRTRQGPPLRLGPW